MEASRAQYCALVWCALERPAEFHPYLTLGTDGKSKLQSLPKELEQISRRESLTGRLSSGQTRANKWAGIFLAEREGRSWFLILQSQERLRVGRDVGREVEVAFWGATWAVARIGQLEPTGSLDTKELLAKGEAAEEASAFADAASQYRRAYEVSLATGDTDAVIYSSWYGGRALRKLAQWDEAMSWYARAREVARDAGRMGLVASVTVGLANVRLHKGALLEATDLYREVVQIGMEAENKQAVAQGYLGLMWIHRLEEDWRAAARVGWQALSLARGFDDEWDILVALSDCFRMLGRVEEAKSCNLLTSKCAPLPETRQIATHNLAVIAALQGDETAFANLRSEVDPASMSAMGRVQVLGEQGQVLCALGREEEGRRLIETALREAESMRLGKLVFEIEDALKRDRPWDSLMGPDLTPRDAEEDEIRTQLELIASAV